MTAPDPDILEGLDAGIAAWRDEVPPPVTGRVHAAVHHDAAAVRPLWPAWVRFLVAAAVGAGNAAGITLVMMHPSWQALLARGLPGWYWVTTLLAWAGAALVLTWMAVHEADPRVPVRSTSRFVAGLALVAGFAAVALGTELMRAGHLEGAGPAYLHHGMHCLTLGTVFEVLPVAVILALVARGMPFHPVRAGILAGLACGAWSLLLLELGCPDTRVVHAIPFHLGVAGVWALLGAGVGGLLAWRQRRRAA